MGMTGIFDKTESDHRQDIGNRGCQEGTDKDDDRNREHEPHHAVDRGRNPGDPLPSIAMNPTQPEWMRNWSSNPAHEGLVMICFKRASDLGSNAPVKGHHSLTA